MTVRELIEALEKIENQDLPIKHYDTDSLSYVEVCEAYACKSFFSGEALVVDIRGVRLARTLFFCAICTKVLP